jgi:ribosomal protein S8
MDKKEAITILEEHLVRFSRRDYRELAVLVEEKHIDTFEALGNSGTRYQVEIQFLWDDQSGGLIKIFGSVDNGGIRSYFPLSRSELISRPT